MTYRLSIESNKVGWDHPYFMLGVYEDEQLCRLDAMGLMNFLCDDIKTIGIKKFNGTEFELLDVYDGQEWQSDIEAWQDEEFERHGA